MLGNGRSPSPLYWSRYQVLEKVPMHLYQAAVRVGHLPPRHHCEPLGQPSLDSFQRGTWETLNETVMKEYHRLVQCHVLGGKGEVETGSADGSQYAHVR